jgi:hypothetical protein
MGTVSTTRVALHDLAPEHMLRSRKLFVQHTTDENYQLLSMYSTASKEAERPDSISLGELLYPEKNRSEPDPLGGVDSYPRDPFLQNHTSDHVSLFQLEDAVKQNPELRRVAYLRNFAENVNVVLRANRVISPRLQEFGLRAYVKTKINSLLLKGAAYGSSMPPHVAAAEVFKSFNFDENEHKTEAENLTNRRAAAYIEAGKRYFDRPSSDIQGRAEAAKHIYKAGEELEHAIRSEYDLFDVEVPDETLEKRISQNSEQVALLS